MERSDPHPAPDSERATSHEASVPALPEDELERLEQQVRQRAFLFPDPDAYSGGVEDAFTAVRRARSGDAPTAERAPIEGATSTPPP